MVQARTSRTRAREVAIAGSYRLARIQLQAVGLAETWFPDELTQRQVVDVIDELHRVRLDEEEGDAAFRWYSEHHAYIASKR